jgi:hypothetical protein
LHAWNIAELLGCDCRTLRKRQKKQRLPVMLTSIRNLLANVAQDEHKPLTEALLNHTFVGCADANFALIQHATKLYLVNVCSTRYVRLVVRVARSQHSF